MCIVYDGMWLFPLDEFAETRSATCTWAEHLAPVDEADMQDFLNNTRTTHGLIIPSFDLYIEDAPNDGETPETLITISHQSLVVVDPESSPSIGNITCHFNYRKIGGMHRDQWIVEDEMTMGAGDIHRGMRRDPELDAAYFKAYPRMRDILPKNQPNAIDDEAEEEDMFIWGSSAK